MKKKLKRITIVSIFAFISTFGMMLSPETSNSATPRIIGGDKADEEAFPWMVSLVDAYESDNYNAHRCGGSLIHSRWVITAAHCVKDEMTGRNISNSSIEVLVGVYDLKNDEGERISVKRIIAHPDYDSWTLDSDIALLELEEDVSYKTISLVSDDNSLDGQESVVIGWGTTNSDKSEYPYLLQEVSVPIVSNEVCNDAYQSSNSDNPWMNWWLGYYQEDEVTDNMLCAGYADGGSDSCTGDSGGPLMVEEDETWKLAGIVSWGNGCAEPGYYGVYTRVSKFSDFINKYISEEEETSSCGDINGDGVVDRNDLYQKYQDLKNEYYEWFWECWFPKEDCGDYNGSGKVSRTDRIEKLKDVNQELRDWIDECWKPES